MSEDINDQLDLQIKTELERIELKKSQNLTKGAESIEEIHTSDIKDQVKDKYHDEAVKIGWNPNYDGPNKKDAKRFIEDKSFFDKIAAQNRKIDELTNMVNETINHSTRLEKAAYDKALKDLEQAKIKAVSEADLMKYNSISEQEKIVKSQVETIKSPVKQEYKPTNAQMEFLERNKTWFNKDNAENIDMVEDADYIDKRIAKQLVRQGKTISQAEHLQMVEDAIRKQYPNRFENDNQKKATLVGKSTISSKNAGTINEVLTSRLTAQQKDFLKRAQKLGSKLTLETYAKQLELTGDLRHE